MVLSTARFEFAFTACSDQMIHAIHRRMRRVKWSSIVALLRVQRRAVLLGERFKMGTCCRVQAALDVGAEVVRGTLLHSQRAALCKRRH